VPVSPRLIRIVHHALIGHGLPLLHLAQDGAKPGAPRDERRLGLVARVLVELTNAVVYGADAPIPESQVEEIRRAVADLAEALGVETRLTIEGARALAYGKSVDLGDATVLTRLLTHYPSNVAWHDDVNELYAWSQA
jgi:hypothetical protein